MVVGGAGAGQEGHHQHHKRGDMFLYRPHHARCQFDPVGQVLPSYASMASMVHSSAMVFAQRLWICYQQVPGHQQMPGFQQVAIHDQVLCYQQAPSYQQVREVDLTISANI